MVSGILCGMAKPLLILIVVAVVIGGAYFWLNYEVQPLQVDGRPAGWRIVPREAGQAAAQFATADPAAPPRTTIRIASYNLGRFDEAKLANRRVADVLARLLPRFDLIALQGVRGKNRGVLVRLVEQLNAATGRSYDFAVCPTQRRDAVEHYCAFVFDARRIEIDRRTVRSVEDRQGRFRVKPLVGSFRARGPDPAEAFTFTLINVETDPQHAAVELDLLAEAFQAVLNDGRNEDDVILLGSLENDDQNLGRLGRMLGVTALLARQNDAFSTVRGTQLLDNILIDRNATAEFSGRVEAVDVMRECELTMPGALEVSERLPIWAEFSVYEGGQPGQAK